MSNSTSILNKPLNSADQTAVAMGEAVVAAKPTQLTTIVGSCIAVALYSSELRLGMLGHVVLPNSTGSTAYPAKFADTCVPHMISILHGRGANRDKLVAKIAGGACMFGPSKSMHIGSVNVQATIDALDAHGIRLIGRDVGGTVGRRISFDLATGSLTVDRVGHPSLTI
jgi:chemotaxis protein CheD